jgi:hypothetical protein
MNQTMKPPMPKKPKSKMRQRISGRDGNSAMFDTAEQTKMNEMMRKRRDKDKRTGPKEPTDDDTMAMKKGGMTKKYAAGGKLEMVEKDGKKVPFYAADGKGKMASGGKVKKMMRGGPAGMYGEGPAEKQMKAKTGADKENIDMKKGGKVSEAKKEAKKAVKKHEDKMHKKTKKMASGGKVRGAGMAKKGVRPCKMR